MAGYKREMDISYSFGIFPTYELLLHRPQCARRILVSDRLVDSSQTEQLFELAHSLGIPVETAPKRVHSLVDKDNIYIVGEFDKYGDTLSDGDHLVLVNPADMGNLGNIMRTALGFGILDLAIIGEGADYFSPKTVRASMGAVFSMRVEPFENFEIYAEKYREGRRFYPFMTDGASNLKLLKPSSPYSFIFGNESSGLPHSFSSVGQPVRIAHQDRIDSLNLTTAVAIALFWARSSSEAFHEE